MLQKLKPLYAVEKLKKKNIKLFTPLEFRRVFNVSQCAAQWFIKTYTKKKLFLKLKNGLYVLKDSLPSAYSIANRLYQPSYISFDAALSYYGIIPETIYTVTSATSKTTRTFEIEGINYDFRKIKKDFYTGYKAIKYSDETILIAEPEKALADYLYFVVLKKRELHYERLNLKKVKKNKLLFYAKLFKKPEIIKLINKLYVEQRKPKRIY